MSKICDNKSVGVIIQNERNEVLLIERKKFPFGFAAPAGHIDEFPSPEACARGEVKEEVGLEITSLELVLEGRHENVCRRENGSFHYWYVYKAKVTGSIYGSKEETKQVCWVSKEKLQELNRRSEQYILNNISEEEWRKEPGLEPIWSAFFKETAII